MRAIAIADDDSLIGRLPVSPTDLLLSLGDLWDSSIEKAVARYQPSQVFAVRGNHDTDAPLPASVVSLHYTLKKFRGLLFGGFGGSWKYKPKGHHLFDQHEVSRMLNSFPRVDVFIAHNSPRGIHERDDHTHQGFDGFLGYIEKHQPRYFIHGHQHFEKTSFQGQTEVIGVFGEKTIEIN